ncbi:MAG TPA: ATP-binding cassette domain-containing protein, partial [Geminicoccaceae bacterium]|nr:ATP-binding cassette domain-containing protein [Geminicoccaceae bacterium]
MSGGRRPVVRASGLVKRFGGFAAVDGVDFEVDADELFALLGPSGCGKTTLLRLIAGFETATEGRVLIDGLDMAGVPPNRRPVNTVFQSYAVFPHMSVADNVAYGLKVTGVPRPEIARRVADALAMVRLEGFEAR